MLARGALLFVGGQIGWNAKQEFESDDFIVQTRQALQNILAVLQVRRRRARTHGAHDLVRRRQGGICRQAQGAGRQPTARSWAEFPAMTCVEVADLVEDRARVEIEVTAVVPD